MARPYGSKFLSTLSNSTQDSLGMELARLCVEANLSAAHVAMALEVTRTTVYGWFRGQGVREAKRRDVEALIALVQKDLLEGALPVSTVVEGRTYIESLIRSSI